MQMKSKLGTSAFLAVAAIFASLVSANEVSADQPVGSRMSATKFSGCFSGRVRQEALTPLIRPKVTQNSRSQCLTPLKVCPRTFDKCWVGLFDQETRSPTAKSTSARQEGQIPAEYFHFLKSGS